MEGAEKMIEFKNVSFSYKEKNVLDNFNLKIASGERICLFAKSGRGKTTVLRLITGLEKPDKGEVRLGSDSISAVFQEDRLLPFKTVRENINEFSDGKNTDEILGRLGIISVADSYPSVLSGGMARRVAIARALCKESDIYIFDEPFTGLDKENIISCSEVINDMTEGKTVVAVLHEKEYASLINCTVKEI